jgi:hypothetical protein
LASADTPGCVDGVGGAGVWAPALALIEASCDAEASVPAVAGAVDWRSDWLLVEALAALSVVIELSVEVAPLVDAEVSVEAPASVEPALLVDDDVSAVASVVELAELVSAAEFVSAAASAATSALASMLCACVAFEPPSQSAAANAGAAQRSERFMACSPVLVASKKSVRRSYAGYPGQIKHTPCHDVLAGPSLNRTLT